MVAAASSSSVENKNHTLLTEAAFTRAFVEGPHRWVDVDYARIATWSFGQGPDVVFVHGWPLWSATFRRIAPLLARSFRLHFFDLPGAGKTITRDFARINFKDHVEALSAVVKALGLERFALVAHDSGGAIARMFAARTPNVTALVLGNTELPDHVPWQVKIYVVMAKLGLGSLLAGAMKVGAIRRSPLGFGGCFEDANYVDGEFGRLIVDRLNEPGGFEGQMSFVKNLVPAHLGDLNAVHASIRCPTLCIWGADDPFFPIERARSMMSAFGGDAKFLAVGGGKVFVHEDHAEEFAKATHDFLAERILS